MYYSADKLLTYNCLFNFVMSNRGGGKTFDFKCRAIRNFIKKGKKFVYLRRYKSEFKKNYTFFDDIIAEGKFQGHELTVKGRDYFIDGKHAGYGLVLSTAMTTKSASFPDVTLIGFDEFAIKKGHLRYLDDEVTSFLEMYETIARSRDDVRVIFMANNISIVNPYFLYWNIQPDPSKRIGKYGTQIAVEMFTDDEFVEMKKKTRFGQIIDGTTYGNYAINNESLVDTDDFIEKKSKNAKFICAVYYDDHYIGFWTDYSLGKIYASTKYDPTTQMMFTLTTEEHRPNMLLISNVRKSYHLSMITKAFQQGYLYFDNQSIKNLCYDMFRLFKM